MHSYWKVGVTIPCLLQQVTSPQGIRGVSPFIDYHLELHLLLPVAAFNYRAR